MPVLMMWLLWATAGWAGHPPAFVFKREAVALSATANFRGVAVDEQRWLARRGNAVWALQPQPKRVVRLALSAAAGPMSGAATTAWPLPPGVTLEAPREGFLGLAPWGETGTWLVDGQRQTLWRLENGTWQGPWPLPDPVADAVALGPHELVVQTPTHPNWVFARVGVAGSVHQRFGRRLLAAFEPLDRFENTWRLALSEDGRTLFAAHVFRPLLRSYELARVENVVETELTSPEAKRLDALREQALAAIRLNPESGCLSCRLVRFASALETTPAGELYVHWGRACGLERLDAEGRWLDTVPVLPPNEEWVAAGVAVAGTSLLALEAEGVVQYRRLTVDTLLTLRVVDEDGQPVPGAKIDIDLPDGLHHSLQTPASGEVTLPSPAPDQEVSLRVSAPGFRHLQLSGLAREVLAEPLVLRRADRLCVAVTAKASRAPVTRFELSVFCPSEGVDIAGIEGGDSLQIEDPEGSGCIEAPWDYPVLLKVRAEGFASHEVKLAARPEEPVPVELDPAAVLRVVVADAQGGRIAKAEVALRSGSAASALAWAVGSDNLALTDDAGEAVLARLPAGTYRVTVRREGFLDWEGEWSLEAGETTKKVTLDRGVRVLVRVSDRRTGAGIREARVELAGHRLINRRLECSTSSDGRCEITGVPAGTFLAKAAASGRASTTQNFVVTSGTREVPLEIRMAAGVRLYGRVAGAEMYDTPLAVRISVPGFAVREGAVGPDGSYVLEDVPPGRGNVWVCEKPAGGTLAHLLTTFAEDRDTQQLDLEVPPPQVLVGWVREASGPCFPCRAVVTLLGADVNRPRTERHTDTSGRFEARLPVPGSYRVEIWGREGTLRLAEVVELTTSLERTFELDEGGVEGHVVDVNRVPVPGATIRLFRPAEGRVLRQLTSGAGGDFRCERLPAGPLHIVAGTEHGWSEVEVTVVAGEMAPVELVLERREQLPLRLLDEATALPLPMASLGMQLHSGVFAVYPLRGDPKGTYTLQVAPGEVSAVVVAVPGYAVATVRGPFGSQPREVLLSRQARSFNVDVRPEAGTPCSVTLLDASGLPIALTGEAPPGPVPLQARTAMFNFLPAGSYELVVHTCEGGVFRRPLVLAPGTVPAVVLP